MSVTTLRLKAAVAVLLGLILLSFLANWESAKKLYQHIAAVDAVADQMAAGDQFTTAVLRMVRMAGESEVSSPPELQASYEQEKMIAKSALVQIIDYAKGLDVRAEGRTNTDKAFQIKTSFEQLQKRTDAIFKRSSSTHATAESPNTPEFHHPLENILLSYSHIQTSHTEQQKELCEKSGQIWQATTRTFIIQISITIILMVLIVFYLDRIVVKMFEITERLALHDKLTGALNRHALNRIVKDKFTGEDTQRDYSVILLDIDHFKHFNDTYGHDAGDSVLIEVVHSISTSVRKQDKVIRYGGEEFLVFLPSTQNSGALEVGEKIRTTIEAMSLTLPDGTSGVQITISAGVAVASKEMMFDETVKMADNRLYQAKKAGRNRVVG